LAAELHTKGVDNDVITSVLGGINPAAERGRAEQLVRSRLGREKLGDDDADLRVSRRLVAMLARRGFSQTMAYDVVSVELAAERERRRV
jgi:regulatory protein